MSKIAVILFNLGGPDSKNAIKPFLMNFFMDKNIINLPLPLRYLLAKKISNRRSKHEAKESYGELGGRSPLLGHTQKQAKILEKALNKAAIKNQNFKTFVCMRYWHPMAGQIVREVRTWDADQIILLPLYPQFSTTTTWSSLGEWSKAMFEAGYKKPINMVCCYFKNSGFMKASVKNIKDQIKAAKKDKHKNIRILFSAHGLPEDIVDKGDPYQWQCEQTAKTIADNLKIKNLDWAICYQSRVGLKKWIGPSLDEELQRAAIDKKAVIIYPHSFTQEHVETLAELDIEYKAVAKKLGVKGYYRAQTVGTHPDFIKGLVDLVKNQSKKKGVKTEGGRCACPKEFNRCCMRNNKGF